MITPHGTVFIVTAPCSCGGDQVGILNDDGLTETHCTIHLCQITQQVDFAHHVQRWTKLKWEKDENSLEPDQKVLLAKRCCCTCGFELVVPILKGGTWTQSIDCPRCETRNHIRVGNEERLREALETIVDEIRFDGSGFTVRSRCPSCHKFVRREIPSNQLASIHDPERVFMSCPDCDQLIPLPWFWKDSTHAMIQQHELEENLLPAFKGHVSRPTRKGDWKVVWKQGWNGHHESHISFPCPNCDHLMTSKANMDCDHGNVLCTRCKLQLAIPMEFQRQDRQNTAPAGKW
ncbi:hypothetical protein A2239_02320 [Candidatus Uhrbacteria bacterium RIFOXYA2_FULL_40_9]|nr:MAG: hypothetical protein A2239_02320 [Candidatus Uhrbacteria bacterium RIFOXYA2_FULL_40_9]OGL97883.1 MAG: hypothetical protein A2332_01830 [Candidatus Uhrbacteria bacterium RIFOXYB2_FULL_41_18]HBK34812.1 hypothetical protein [Candidatus Uhrbacteria bacterium]HCB55680.1 hypothetical protein [Candidatus Uhrbacteria bacterium]